MIEKFGRGGNSPFDNIYHAEYNVCNKIFIINSENVRNDAGIVQRERSFAARSFRGNVRVAQERQRGIQYSLTD
jgi:hypothetical protein